MSLKIITHFCSPEEQKAIGKLCASLTEAKTLPFEIEHIQNLAAPPEGDCLFFVSVSEKTIDDLRNLLNRKTPAKRQIVIVSNREYNYFQLAFEYEICNIIHISKLCESLFCGMLSSFFHSPAAPISREPTAPAAREIAAPSAQQNSSTDGELPPEDILDNFFNKEIKFDTRCSLSGCITMKDLIRDSFADTIDKLPAQIRYAFTINFHELINNALAYGVKGITPQDRDTKISQIGSTVEIPQGKEVLARIVMDGEHYGISVKDHGGTLTKRRILEKIRRQSVVAGETIQLGIDDLSGRGLIILSHQGLLIFRIKPGISTEVALVAPASTLAEETQFSILTMEG